MQIELPLFLPRRGHRLTTKEKREEQAQNNAEDDAGNDREIETEVASLDANVARQTSDPTGAEAAPKSQSNQDNDDPEDDEDFANFGHEQRDRRGTCRQGGAPPATHQGFRIAGVEEVSNRSAPFPEQ
jgi:hypothetical protein